MINLTLRELFCCICCTFCASGIELNIESAWILSPTSQNDGRIFLYIDQVTANIVNTTTNFMIIVYYSTRVIMMLLQERIRSVKRHAKRLFRREVPAILEPHELTHNQTLSGELYYCVIVKTQRLQNEKSDSCVSDGVQHHRISQKISAQRFTVTEQLRIIFANVVLHKKV
ncbi:hypothetical protein Bhyg_06145 [Pseudolycoriella hygida]|uniref:Uncharacterized protein n=1 Tax=Pseudolycoriella hygida TaxID=35572 RepID=A0A9Q0N078_9DIPT|nr:hypothetical protein Bhyg_06145 [Pseudolycoriella hygida]